MVPSLGADCSGTWHTVLPFILVAAPQEAEALRISSSYVLEAAHASRRVRGTSQVGRPESLEMGPRPSVTAPINASGTREPHPLQNLRSPSPVAWKRDYLGSH